MECGGRIGVLESTMLKAIKAKTFRAGDARFAIVASQYNGRYVDAMLRGGARRN